MSKKKIIKKGMGEKLANDDFLKLFCEKNSDGTIHLRLKGKELFQRIGTRIKPKHMQKIASFLRENNNIISVDFSYNEIGDEGIQILVDNYFNEENVLKELNVMHCDILDEGMKALANSKYMCLTACRLNGNKLGAVGARHIAKLIENCPTLEYIDIAETDQTLESIESILIVIEHTTLKVLNISRIIPNSYYAKYNKATLATDLGVTLKQNETIRELYIQKCEFDGHDVELLMDGLQSNKNLEMLDLGCNCIGDLGMEILASWLRTRPALRGLIVKANGIRDAGARALSFGLPFSKIRFLDISENKIGDTGLMDVLDTLKKSCQMRLFNIWGNTIGPVSCKRLSRMIASGVLDQEYIDVKIYTVDEQLFAAFYPNNCYKNRYYCVMDYGCPVELKIKRNKVYDERALPRKLMDFQYIDRYPPVDESLGLAPKTC